MLQQLGVRAKKMIDQQAEMRAGPGDFAPDDGCVVRIGCGFPAVIHTAKTENIGFEPLDRSKRLPRRQIQSRHVPFQFGQKVFQHFTVQLLFAAEMVVDRGRVSRTSPSTDVAYGGFVIAFFREHFFSRFFYLGPGIFWLRHASSRRRFNASV